MPVFPSSKYVLDEIDCRFFALPILIMTKKWLKETGTSRSKLMRIYIFILTQHTHSELTFTQRKKMMKLRVYHNYDYSLNVVQLIIIRRLNNFFIQRNIRTFSSLACVCFCFCRTWNNNENFAEKIRMNISENAFCEQLRQRNEKKIANSKICINR